MIATRRRSSYPHVPPWGHRLAFSDVVICLSLSLYAGTLPRLCLWYEESERHLMRGAEVNGRVRAQFFVAPTHLEIARLHEEREAADDASRQPSSRALRRG
jgi:hypothetical protein